MAKEEMVNKIIKQLRRFYGGFADNYTSSEIRLTNNISEIIGKGFGTRMEDVSANRVEGTIHSIKLFNRALSKDDIKTMTKEEFIKVPRDLLESLKNDIIELVVENNWRRMSTKWNQQYLEVLENKIERVEELLAGKNKAREQDLDS